MIKDLIADILFLHASFRGFSQSYNYRHSLKQNVRDKLNYKRLADVYYAFHLNIFHDEHLDGQMTS